MKHIILIASVLLITGLNFYLSRGIRALFNKPGNKRIFNIVFWIWSIPLPILILSIAYLPTEVFKGASRAIILSYILFDVISKLILLLFFLFDDGLFLAKKKIRMNKEKEVENPSRKKFLKQTGMAASLIPVTGFSFGIIKGGHDYQWFEHKIKVPGLPKAFHGLRIGQLSDIHSGSFYNKSAVMGGVEMFMKEKTDIVFFTGDIVNDQAREIKDYFDVFSKVKAPLGVYSTLGNHDYGNYTNWKSREAKIRNFKGIVDAHEQLGWELLRNENRILELEGERLGIIGVENWSSSSRFPKYGDLIKAKAGTERLSHNILLSHDPSHWEAQIMPEHDDIFLTLSGHTHGFQMGIETPFFRWSPAQYLYKQWAGMYNNGSQYLNVNRGFGFIGYPGRIGIAPELSLIELLSV